MMGHMEGYMGGYMRGGGLNRPWEYYGQPIGRHTDDRLRNTVLRAGVSESV